MRFLNMLFAFPFILPAVGTMAILGPNSLSAAIAIAIVNVPSFAHLRRDRYMVICQSIYIKGAEIIGASDIRL